MAPGQILGELKGSARSILVAERIMLNFMQVGGRASRGCGRVQGLVKCIGG